MKKIILLGSFILISSIIYTMENTEELTNQSHHHCDIDTIIQNTSTPCILQESVLGITKLFFCQNHDQLRQHLEIIAQRPGIEFEIIEKNHGTKRKRE